MSLQDILLGFFAGLAYFIESVFGFGGTVIFLGLSGLAFDFKLALTLAIYCSCTASFVILLQTWRHFSAAHAKRLFLMTLPGVFIGTWLMDILSGPLLLNIFAGLLVAYAAKEILRPEMQPPKSLGALFVTMGGLAQGVFSTGGPFVLMGYKNNFATRTEMKATMAAFFLVCNILRIGQISLAGTATEIYRESLHYWWIALPIAAGVMLGHGLHLKLPEALFQKGIRYGLLLIGISLFFR